MKRIWTNGCFDILHIGHIELLKYAKSLGDYLYVGIDSDNRIKSSKGSNRPINNEKHRKAMLESIRYVDTVIIFDKDQTLRDCIKKFSIDNIVVGDDYIKKEVIGSEYAQVIFFPKISGFSTTNIITLKNKWDL
jgi:rfaE bifunctional protein nucleotidyltransferase chain/domain